MRKIDCKRPFSNGTECELFLDHCADCARCRNYNCAIINRIFKAMWDINYFPYEYLWEYEGIGGMSCKRFITELPPRKKRDHPMKGQMEIEI